MLQAIGVIILIILVRTILPAMQKSERDRKAEKAYNEYKRSRGL